VGTRTATWREQLTVPLDELAVACTRSPDPGQRTRVYEKMPRMMVDIDDDLLEEARRLSGARTKTDEIVKPPGWSGRPGGG